MNRLKAFIWFSLAIALWIPTTVFAASNHDDQVIMGGSYVLAEGEELDGNLIVLGGTAKIETDATVHGDVILMGGQVNVDGTIEGNLSLYGGSGSLEKNAVIEGNVTVYSSALNSNENSVIEGKITRMDNLPNGFTIPDPVQKPEVPSPSIFTSSDDNPVMRFITTALWIIFGSIATAIIAMILALFFPRAMQISAEAIVKNPLLASGVGLLTTIAAPIAAGLAAITLILIPVSALIALVFIGAVFFGWIILGMELGERIRIAFKVNWHPAITAGLGNLLLTFVLLSVWQLPCLGWAMVSLAAIFGLGGVILTRFGTRLFNNEPAEHESNTAG